MKHYNSFENIMDYTLKTPDRKKLKSSAETPATIILSESKRPAKVVHNAIPLALSFSEKYEDLEDLVDNSGPDKKLDMLDSVRKGLPFKYNTNICTLIQNGKIIFKQEIGRGKNGSTILSRVRGLKKGGEYVVKVPHTRKILACTSDEVSYPRLDGKGNTIFPAGSYSCNAELSEAINSLFVAELVRDKYSINFLDTFYFATCFNVDRVHYLFMEKADGTLSNEFSHLPNEDINSLYIQLLHSIALIQEKYQMVHGDLHFDNILLKMEKTSVCRKYEFGDEVYTPPSKYIAFPADWGVSIKYSNPCVGNIGILKGQYGQSMPNFFSSSYDVVYMTNCFMYELNRVQRNNDFIKKIYDWINFKVDDKEKVYFYKNDINMQRPRADMLDVFSHVSPLNILQNKDLMSPYTKSSHHRKCELGGKFK